jgi:hypothetical protein
MAGETVWRQHATGGDIPTAFSALPYEHADAYSLSEFYGSARQSRVSMMAEGKPMGQRCAATSRPTSSAPAPVPTAISPTAICCVSAWSGVRRAEQRLGLHRRPALVTRYRRQEGHLQLLRRHPHPADHRPELLTRASSGPASTVSASPRPLRTLPLASRPRTPKSSTAPPSRATHPTRFWAAPAPTAATTTPPPAVAPTRATPPTAKRQAWSRPPPSI